MLDGISFETSKKSFKDGFEVYYAKDFLFSFYSVKQISDLLKEKGIVIDEKKILEEYKKCYNIDKLASKYDKKYSKQLDKIDEEFVLLDSDCIFLVIRKIVEENIEVMKNLDIAFVSNQLEIIQDDDDENKINDIIQLYKNLNDYHQFTNTKKFEDLFGDYDDCSWEILDLVGIEAHNCFPTYKKAKQLYDEVVKLIDNYKVYDSESLLKDAIELLASHGYNKCKNELEYGINKYPKSKLMMYVGVYTELKITNKEKKVLKQLEETIEGLELKTEQDADYLDIFYEWKNNE